MRTVRKYAGRLLALVVLCAFLIFGVLMYGKVSELANQLSYLQDTTNIILSDMEGMQSNIEETLEQEASMMESYTIDVTDMNFAENTYDVEISVIPKEYTDSTKVSIYFGTTECPLEKDGYLYTGTVTLPIAKTFDGNVTFLLANGKNKTTEVVRDFEGLSGKFDEVLTGSMAGTPVCKKHTLSLDGFCSYELNGVSLYTFDHFEAVLELDGEEIQTQELTQTANDPALSDVVSGSAELSFSYELPQEESEETETSETETETETQTESESEEAETCTLRIFLRAVTSDGYRFETQLLQEEFVAGEERLDADSLDTTVYQYVYDRQGNEREIP